MWIYIFILIAILGILYYITKEPYTTVVPVRTKSGKKKYIIRRRKPVGWDLLYPFVPGYPSYPYVRYLPYRRGYSY